MKESRSSPSSSPPSPYTVLLRDLYNVKASALKKELESRPEKHEGEMCEMTARFVQVSREGYEEDDVTHWSKDHID